MVRYQVYRRTRPTALKCTPRKRGGDPSRPHGSARKPTRTDALATGSLGLKITHNLCANINLSIPLGGDEGFKEARHQPRHKPWCGPARHQAAEPRSLMPLGRFLQVAVPTQFVASWDSTTKKIVSEVSDIYG
jgi:hypothetical protein